MAFSKNGGNLGETGCVSYLFDRKGYLVIEREDLNLDEDDMLLQAIEAGAEEMETSEEAFEIYTDPENFMEVKENLEKAGFTFATAEITMVPQTYTVLDDEQSAKMEKLLDMLEDNDDVQEIYHNYQEA
jgi:YebC/PmpR family DNA-binding regulatory protein